MLNGTAKAAGILVILGALTLTACSGSKEDEKGPLSVYRVENDALYMSALDTYQKENPELALEVKTFPTYQEMKDQLNTELMSGKGPDVLLYNSLYSESDPFKLADSGAFLSLDSYVEGLSADEYFGTVLEAGKIGGTQYLMPLSWNFLQVYTSESLAEEQGYQGKSLYEILPAEYNRLENSSDNALCSMQFARADVVNFMAEISGTPILGGDEVSLRQTAEFAKLFYDNIPKMKTITQKYKNDFAGVTAHLSFLMEDYPFMNNLRYYQTLYPSAVGAEAIMYPVGQRQGGLTVQVIQYGAINVSTKSPDEAWSLLRALADSPCSMNFSKYEEKQGYYAPVNVSVYNDCVKELSAQSGPGAKKPSEPLNKANTSLLMQIPQQITLAVIPNSSIGTLAEECMMPYLTGSKDFESCYQDLISKLELYLDE